MRLLSPKQLQKHPAFGSALKHALLEQYSHMLLHDKDLQEQNLSQFALSRHLKDIHALSNPIYQPTIKDWMDVTSAHIDKDSDSAQSDTVSHYMNGALRIELGVSLDYRRPLENQYKKHYKGAALSRLLDAELPFYAPKPMIFSGYIFAQDPAISGLPPELGISSQHPPSYTPPDLYLFGQIDGANATPSQLSCLKLTVPIDGTVELGFIPWRQMWNSGETHTESPPNIKKQVESESDHLFGPPPRKLSSHEFIEAISAILLMGPRGIASMAEALLIKDAIDDPEQSAKTGNKKNLGTNKTPKRTVRL